jgi:hypothetical protein
MRINVTPTDKNTTKLFDPNQNLRYKTTNDSKGKT